MMKNYQKVEFPSQNFSKTLKKCNIFIDDELFCKYKLLENMDEQSLQNILYDMYNTKDEKKLNSLLFLVEEIKELNPELNIVKTPKESIFHLKHFLHGVASRFTPRDINYYLSLRSEKENKMIESKRQIQDIKIKRFTGSFVNFILEPKIMDKIIYQIDQKENQQQTEREINEILMRNNPRGLMEH